MQCRQHRTPQLLLPPSTKQGRSLKPPGWQLQPPSLEWGRLLSHATLRFPSKQACGAGAWMPQDLAGPYISRCTPSLQAAQDPDAPADADPATRGQLEATRVELEATRSNLERQLRLVKERQLVASSKQEMEVATTALGLLESAVQVTLLQQARHRGPYGERQPRAGNRVALDDIYNQAAQPKEWWKTMTAQRLSGTPNQIAVVLRRMRRHRRHTCDHCC